MQFAGTRDHSPPRHATPPSRTRHSLGMAFKITAPGKDSLRASATQNRHIIPSQLTLDWYENKIACELIGAILDMQNNTYEHSENHRLSFWHSALHVGFSNLLQFIAVSRTRKDAGAIPPQSRPVDTFYSRWPSILMDV